MTMADIATVTPELEAACRKLVEGVQLGGPYLPVSYKRLRVQFPGNHGGVNWGGTSFNPQLGSSSRTSTISGSCHGLTDRDPNATGSAQANGSRQSRRSERPVPGLTGRRPLQGRRVEHDVPAAAVGRADAVERAHR